MTETDRDSLDLQDEDRLPWLEAVDDGDVEETAIELAKRAGADPELARRTASSLRTVLGPPALPWAAALELAIDQRARRVFELSQRLSSQPETPGGQ